MPADPFTSNLSRRVWDSRYRDRSGPVHEQSVGESWQRVANAVASVEPHDQAAWEKTFFQALTNFRFLPGGRILAGAGVPRQVTLFNCFVMGTIEDSMDGIFDALKEGALTMQQGGGVGYDFSTLRPAGTPAGKTGAIASGPVSFMRIWDAMCATVLSSGERRGAMMGTLRCDHPDIEQFIGAKQESGQLRHFNLSVLISDAFMSAVEQDTEWRLLFPAQSLGAAQGELVECPWPGFSHAIPCRVVRSLSARQLWERIMRATYAYAEPGVLFIDRINRLNNLSYRERIAATNPCGEIPLPPYGACDLGSINLCAFVRDPFGRHAHVDLDALRATVRTAVRMMDNVIDLSRYPLAMQAEQALGSRRIGLGLTGLADALVMLNQRYDSAPGRGVAARMLAAIRDTAYRTSVELAREKGAFPFLNRDAYLRAPFVSALPAPIRRGIAAHGIRNSHLIAVAPTGTISLLANNVSSGLEPVFDLRYVRRLVERDGSHSEYEVLDYAYQLWRELHGNMPVPDTFQTARTLPAHAHLAMQAALQPYVDNAVSKTINVPETLPFEDFKDLYRQAYAQGLKGCTTFRPNPVTGSILEIATAEQPCCALDGGGVAARTREEFTPRR